MCKHPWMWYTPWSNSFGRMALCLAPQAQTQLMQIRTLLACLLLSALTIISCKKDDEEDPAPAPVNTCGITGMRLQGTIGSESFCANASLFADLAIVLTSNGISQNGATLTMELDSVDTGSYAMGADANCLLFTDQLGLAWNTIDGSGTMVVISSHDTGANRIQGTVTGDLTSPIGGGTRTISASFDLTYTD